MASGMCCKPRNLLVLVALLAAGGCASFTPLPPQPAPSDYRIRPDDSLEFVLYRETPAEETTVSLVVQPDGKIMFPYVGSVNAAGKTPGELQKEVQERYKAVFVTPPIAHLTVSVFPHRVIQVLGFVRQPGQYPLVDSMRATDALARAGWFILPHADANNCTLLRPSGKLSQRHPVHFNEILETGDWTTNFELVPGDVLYVPPTPFRKAALFIEDILSPIHALVAPIMTPITALFGTTTV